jgi:hypothetical protein
MSNDVVGTRSCRWPLLFFSRFPASTGVQFRVVPLRPDERKVHAWRRPNSGIVVSYWLGFEELQLIRRQACVAPEGGGGTRSYTCAIVDT